MNSLDAMRLMIEHYPGGLEAVALRRNKAASTLEKELRGASGFKFGLIDASAIAVMCREAGAEHNLVWITSEATRQQVRLVLPDAHGSASRDVHALLCAAVREASDVTTAVLARKGPAGRSSNDRREIAREIAEAIDALQRLQVALDAEEAP